MGTDRSSKPTHRFQLLATLKQHTDGFYLNQPKLDLMDSGDEQVDSKESTKAYVAFSVAEIASESSAYVNGYVGRTKDEFAGRRMTCRKVRRMTSTVDCVGMPKTLNI